VTVDTVPPAAEALDASAAPAVEMRGISKRFGAVVACDRIDFAVRRGGVTGMLGENGAGKSTLMRILMGLLQPDAGSIALNGQPAHIRDPRGAAAAGLAMVHQHFSLIEPLTVWENLTLGERGRVDPKRAVERVEQVGRRYGLDVDPRARIRDLSAGQRQRVEIIKCLGRDPRVLILDEPTSVLTIAESRELFDVLRHVVHDEGRAVVLISHKLDEILAATDEVVILRRGCVVARHASDTVDARQLAREMVGREVSLHREAAALGLLEVAEATVEHDPTAVEAGANDQPTGVQPTQARTGMSVHVAALQVKDAHVSGRDGRPLLRGLSLTVHAGEIVGLAGVEGNGQTALEDVLNSQVALGSGAVMVRGREVRTGRPGDMQRAGVAVIPEDRHRCGCVLGMTIAENLALGDLDRHVHAGLLSRRSMRARAEELIVRYGIQCASTDAPFRSLSGGNQQRAVLARELSRSPSVLVAAHATRGLDVGAIEYVTAQIREAARSGVGVLLISSELEELIAVADHIAVIHRGQIIGDMSRADIDVERIGMLMGGQAA
jgi:simple sugar transport system ATP-binding protein